MRPTKQTLQDWCMKNNRRDLLEEWDYNKNLNISPTTIGYGSGVKAWWACKTCGYEWSAAICDRSRGTGCPACAGKKVFKGHNDLETWCKNNNRVDILHEWDYAKNKNTKPNDVTYGSNKKYWWKCKHGHSWQASIADRTSCRDCPKCKLQTSFPEQAILYYVKQFFPDAINRYTDLQFELDIYVPSLQVAIEYDGVAFHNKKADIEIKKNGMCKERGIKLIRVREEGLCKYDNCICIMRADRHDSDDLDDSIQKILRYIGILNADVNTMRDNTSILEQYKFLQLENSFANKFPEIAKEWHPTLNGSLRPENISYGSNEKVWWLCENGHEYKMSLKSRSKGCICHVCAKKNANSKLNTACVCVETGITYCSFKEAAKQTGADAGSISLCCKGLRITASGYHWKYANI